MTKRAKRPPAPSESEFAAVAVAHFDSMGWEVFQEVQLTAHGPCADIVAVLRGRPDITHVVECKRSLTFELIAQAERWRRHSHFVSIAVPAAKQSRGRPVAFRVLRSSGVGCFSIQLNAGAVGSCYRCPETHANFNKRATGKFLDVVCDGHKTFAAAGNPDGRRWSEFQSTLHAVRAMLDERGAMPVGEIMAALDHHYASDSSGRKSLIALARRGVLDGIRLDERKRPAVFRRAASRAARKPNRGKTPADKSRPRQ